MLAVSLLKKGSMLSTIFAGIAAFACSALGALGVLPLLRSHGFIDDPRAASRKVHARPIVLGGGIVIPLTLSAVLLVVAHTFPELMPALSIRKWLALAAATLLLMIGGALDDKRQLPAPVQLIAPTLASLLVVWSGIVVARVTNPHGGVLEFGAVWWLPAVLTFVWLMAMMYGTKLLDGLDGLSTGLSAIGGLMIVAFTATTRYYEPRIGFLAAIFAGACLGFLIYNFHPARAFLGEGGSLFLGFFLGILAILSGSKIATTLLVMGLPVFDVVRVMIVRAVTRQSIFRGDQSHFHYLLLRSGLSHRAAVLSYYAVGFFAGLTALILQSTGKLIVLIGLLLCTLMTSIILEARLRR